MTAWEYMAPLLGLERQKFNPNHDPNTGEFSEGGGSGSHFQPKIDRVLSTHFDTFQPAEVRGGFWLSPTGKSFGLKRGFLGHDQMDAKVRELVKGSDANLGESNYALLQHGYVRGIRGNNNINLEITGKPTKSQLEAMQTMTDIWPLNYDVINSKTGQRRSGMNSKYSEMLKHIQEIF